MESNTPKSIYIHIPFCIEKCHYCAFVSYPCKIQKREKYFDALFNEIKETKTAVPCEIRTIYIGGGTPSLVEIKYYKKLFKILKEKFVILDDCEITFEINPKTVNLEYLKELKKLGINRLSIGAQSFNDSILQLINRKHNSLDTKIVVKESQKVGFENISLDIIYGLPSQSLKDIEDALAEVFKLGVQHVSAYGLKIEEGTYFDSNLPKDLPDDDMSADMYLKIIDGLKKQGFEQYEISNFAKIGFESKHNITYWENNEYYGFGLAAHGYIDGVRYANFSEFELYVNNPLEKDFENRLCEKEVVEEAVFLGLRMNKGIDLAKFQARYGFGFEQRYKDILQKFSEFMKIENGWVFLTIDGLMRSNSIFVEFLS